MKQKMYTRSLAHFRQLSATAIVLCSLTSLRAESAGHNALPKDSQLDKEAVERLTQVPYLDISAYDKQGAPTFLTLSDSTLRLKSDLQSAAEVEIRRVADKVLIAHGYSHEDLTLRRKWIDELGALHVLFDQQLHGIPVIHGEIRAHFDKGGRLTALSGMTRKTAYSRLSPLAKITLATAQSMAAEKTKGRSKKSGDGRLVFLKRIDSAELVLAWETVVDATGAEAPIQDIVYIDASTGEELARYPRVQPMYREISDADQASNFGTLVRSEGQPEDEDEDVNKNYDYLGDAHAFFETVNGYTFSTRYNGNTIRSTVDLLGGSYTNNAFWDGGAERFLFGDGDGSTFTHFTHSREIVAHEFTHAFTQYTSNLAYSGEPGAINEAMSDIFGSMVDAWARSGRNGYAIDDNTWKIGEDVYSPYVSGDALRYMANPTADLGMYSDPEFYSRDWYPSRYAGSEDYGGVHFNSGIANLAFKLMVTGGNHPRSSSVWQPLTVPSLGAQVAQKIFFIANQSYLSSGDGFAQLRAATVAAAQLLADAGQAPTDAAQRVHLAWDAVGVGVGGGTGYPVGNSRPMNVSTRSYVGTGGDIAIVGFALGGGSSSQRLLLRAVGPGLSQFGVSGYVPNPTLALYSGTTLLESNDDWGQSANASLIASLASSVGAFALPANSLDAAIVRDFQPGGYSCHFAGGPGTGLVEAYATDYNNPNHLINLSTRCLVSGGAPAIAGISVQGDGWKKLLIRAVGPTLAQFGVSNALSDPKLTVYVGGTVVRENDNWYDPDNFGRDGIAAAAQSVGAFSLPTSSKDAAILMTVPPGVYTVHLNSVSGATGAVLFEVYEIN